MIAIISLISVILLIYYILKSHYKYWERRGVPGPKPIYFFGNVKEALLLKKSMFNIYGDIYRKYNNYPFTGIFKALVPMLVICDPEMAKEVMVKSFRNFHDNDIEADKKVDPIIGRNPFILNGEEWKITRAQVTPGLTSGKIKWMYQILEDNCDKMIKFLSREPSATNGEGYEAKALCSKFTLNNVANCAFGLDAKAFHDENNEFKQIAKDFFQNGLFTGLFFAVTFFFPSLTKLFRLKLINKDVEERLIDIVRNTLKHREENSIVRNDYLQILSDLKKSSEGKNFTEVDITAQAATFFVDGYETSATALSYVLYDLATNPDVQTNLRRDISEIVEDNGQISYEALQKLPYLDAVISESLRLNPPLSVLSKKCTESFTYTPKDGDGITKSIVIEKGTPVVIPVGAMQMDPKYFEDPKIFNPERFLGENKENVSKYVYMPFGEGPRMCLGRRFALVQMKSALAYIIRNFELNLNKKTIVPFQYNPVDVFPNPKGGIWIDFKKISE